MQKNLFKFVTMTLITVSLNLISLSNAAELKSIKARQNIHSGFVIKQDNKIIKTIGKYKDRHSPFSTFISCISSYGIRCKNFRKQRFTKMGV